MSDQYLFEMYRGDDHAMRLEITDSNAAPIDITGWSFRSSMKLSTEDADSKAPVSVQIGPVSGPDAQAGVVYVNLPHEQTKNLIPTVYHFDLQRELDGKISTIFAGKVKILADVTRSGV